MRGLLSMFVAITALSVVVSAQTNDRLTIVGRSDTYQANQEVVAAVDTLAPGATTDWHRHSGTMVAFVSEGTVTVEQERKPPVTFGAGESFIIPSGIAHSSVNNGTAEARMFVTFVASKGKPLSSPVPSGHR